MPNFRTLLPGFVKQMQYDVLKIKTAAKQRVYPKNQATQKNTCQIFQPKKIPESKISNQKTNPSIIPVTWNPENLHLPGRKTGISHWMDN